MQEGERGMRHESDDSYMDLLECNVSGRQYSDDELREQFRQGLKKLEEAGDYDVMSLYSNGKEADYADRMAVVWKALRKMKIRSENLTGRQFSGLSRILYSEIKL